MSTITKRGLVFKEQDGSISLIRLDEEMVVHGLTIGDEDELYDNWPEHHADLVDVDTIGDDMNLVNLTSLQTLTFSRDGKECPAREAINHGLNTEPQKIYQLLTYGANQAQS